MRTALVYLVAALTFAACKPSSPKLGAIPSGGPYLAEPPINFPSVTSGQIAVQLNKGAAIAFDNSTAAAGPVSLYENSSGALELDAGSNGLVVDGPISSSSCTIAGSSQYIDGGTLVVGNGGSAYFDGGTTVQNGEFTINGAPGSGVITYLPACSFSAGTTCAMADTAANATYKLVCGPLFGFADGGSVTAAEISSCILTQGTGWTCTVTASTTALANCYTIH